MILPNIGVIGPVIKNLQDKVSIMIYNIIYKFPKVIYWRGITSINEGKYKTNIIILTNIKQSTGTTFLKKSKINQTLKCAKSILIYDLIVNKK